MRMPDHARRLGSAYAGLAQGLRIFVQFLRRCDGPRLQARSRTHEFMITDEY
jgi:hypothetical protein